MPRGIGEVTVANGLPEWATAVAGVVTQLGDMWFVLVALAGVYWLGKRGSLREEVSHETVLFLFALAIGAYALTVVLKHAFALPRPPGAETTAFPAWLPAIGEGAYTSLVTADGFGFPSGHALKATAVFGGGALVLEIRRRRHQVIAAGILISLVALSRVALGVHYFVDVVAGVAVGVLFLATMHRLASDQPRRALLGAGALGVGAVAIAGTTKAALVVVGAIVGLVVWELSTGSASLPGVPRA